MIISSSIKLLVVAGGTIIIADPMADVEEGDIILRKLPNGKNEHSVVTEATFFNKGVGSIGAQSVQIGDFNTQNIVNSFKALVKKIDASGATSKEKKEAKSLLKKFLEHPLVVTVLGAATGSLLSQCLTVCW